VEIEMTRSNGGSATHDVAVIGCGLMGAALARALADSGRSVAAWNRTPERAEALAGDGITPVRAIEDAVRSTRLIVACLSTYEATVAALEPVAGWDGAVLVNLASGAPEEAAELRRWAAQRGAEYLDGSIVGYPQDIGSAEAAIEQALADWHDDERLSGVEAELEALLRLSDVGLQRTVNRICDYHPPGDGLTYRDWVVQVLGRVHAARR
jgi:ornithine cyclodeaminase/alanine dehydrogenase-like protein (mu-crystallin family)